MLKQRFSWTDVNVDILKRMAGEGNSAAQVGARLGCTRNAVIGKARRLGLKLCGGYGGASSHVGYKPAAPKAKPAYPARRTPAVWTEAKLSEAAKLWADGVPAAEIAAKFGVAPAVFIKTAHRYRGRFPTRNAITNPRKPSASDLGALFEPAGGKAAADGRRFILAGVEPVAFVDLRLNQCRFPVSAPDAPNNASMPCCGAPRAVGRPYCAAHAVISRRVA